MLFLELALKVVGARLQPLVLPVALGHSSLVLHQFQRDAFRGVAEEQTHVRLPVLIPAELGALATYAVLDPFLDDDANRPIDRELDGVKGLLRPFGSPFGIYTGRFDRLSLNLLLGDPPGFDGVNRRRRRRLQLTLRLEVIGIFFGHLVRRRRRRDGVHHARQLHAVHLRPPFAFLSFLLASFLILRQPALATRHRSGRSTGAFVLGP